MAPDELMRQQARSPAYKVLADNDLLESKYRIESSSLIPVEAGKSTPLLNTLTCCVSFCGSQFVVPQGQLRPANDGSGSFFFYGPGVHSVMSCYVKTQANVPLTMQHIINGNQGLVTVQQGFVGYAEDRGQPVLLGPGLHYWKSDTLKFVTQVDLSSPVIALGPYTLVTVDEGYAAVTQDNGKQKIIPGGSVALLTHKNWKFEKFMSEKVQTNDIPPTVLQTGDNVLLAVVATVTWNIVDPGLAARLAAQTLGVTGNAEGDVVMPKLRENVMKQALASLSEFVGSQRYSETLVAPGQEVKPAAKKSPGLFCPDALATSVEHCNQITLRYGVRVSSVNIITAQPADPNLTVQLAAAAVAAAAAEKAEIQAAGEAKAKLIEAQADADAERTRASGAKDAADTLESSELAKTLSRIQRVGEALNGNSTLFFGATASDLPGIFANNEVVRR